jgi:uncharacterized protein (TIGR02266 family)
MNASEEHVHQRRWRRRTVRMLVDWSSGATARCDYATTLGAGGLFIETEDPLPRGTPFKARFRLPGTGALHEVEGRVAWSHVPRPGDTHSPGMGVEFTDPAAMARLARELEALPD